jgi:hypothetical protein
VSPKSCQGEIPGRVKTGENSRDSSTYLGKKISIDKNPYRDSLEIALLI